MNHDDIPQGVMLLDEAGEPAYGPPLTIDYASIDEVTTLAEAHFVIAGMRGMLAGMRATDLLDVLDCFVEEIGATNKLEIISEARAVADELWDFAGETGTAAELLALVDDYLAGLFAATFYEAER